MAWRRIGACPKALPLVLAPQVFCFWLIREPEADRDVYSAHPKWARGKRPDAAGKPAFINEGRDRRSLQRCRSGSHNSKARSTEPEVDAGEVRPKLPSPSFHRSWGKRRRRKRTNPESSRPPGPILKMCATAQAAPHYLSGPALAGQNPKQAAFRGRERQTTLAEVKAKKPETIFVP